MKTVNYNRNGQVVREYRKEYTGYVLTHGMAQFIVVACFVAAIVYTIGGM